jgi:hypothetical protein
MKTKYLLFYFTFIICIDTLAQQESSLPYTYTDSKLKKLDLSKLKTFTFDKFILKDWLKERDTAKYALGGMGFNVTINIKKEGTHYKLKDGTHVWLIRIVSLQAPAMGVWIKNITMPKGSRLFGYSTDKSNMVDVLEKRRHVTRNFEIYIDKIEGNSMIIELSESPEVKEYQEPIIDNIENYFSTNFGSKRKKARLINGSNFDPDAKPALTCHTDFICAAEGNKVCEDIGNAVVKIKFDPTGLSVSLIPS